MVRAKYVRAWGARASLRVRTVTSCDWMSLVVGTRIWDLWGSRGRPNTCTSALCSRPGPLSIPTWEYIRYRELWVMGNSTVPDYLLPHCLPP